MKWLALVTFLLASFFVQGARAEPAAAPLPYAPWDGVTRLGPPVEAVPPGPAPLERSSEFARRTVELVPELGVSLPSCAGADRAESACPKLDHGGFAALGALYRPTPYFAFGGGVLASDFVGAQGASGRLLQLAAVARVYLLEAGHVEPYLELWVGGGTQTSHALELDASDFEQRSIGAGGRVGGGVDFYLGEHIRLGPSFAALRYFASHSEYCRTGYRCERRPLDDGAQLMGAYLLGARLSVSFGSRL